MTDANLYRLMENRFPEDRTQPVIETDTGTVYSYGDLAACCGRFVRQLAACGVKPGDRVAIQVDKSPEAAFLFLACLRAGAVILPLNPAYRAREVAYFLEDAAPRLLVCRPGDEATLAPVARQAGVAQLLTLDTAGGGTLMAESAALDPDAPCHANEADDLAAILYTSGTTGRSKGAMLTHGNLGCNALTLNRIWGFRPDDVLLHALPIFHTHGLFVATNCTLLSGARMLFLPRFDAAAVVRLLPRATVFMGVPTYYTRLLAEPGFDRRCCAAMRLFISGSAPLLEESFHAFEARTGHTILERYGMTETGMNTSNPLDGARLPGTVGPPLPEVEARVCDADGTVLAVGEVGVLEVRGPNVFAGYWQMPEKTAAEFHEDGFFITGDLARIDENGYVSIVGRAKDMVISGGLNVYPKEIESVLDGLPGVAESAVIGVPHPDFGEAVFAVVQRDGNGDALAEDAIIAALKNQLAGYKVPKRVAFVDALPRNTMGKIQKNALRERFKDAFAGAAAG